jgi:hypothetical protein
MIKEHSISWISWPLEWILRLDLRSSDLLRIFFSIQMEHPGILDYWDMDIIKLDMGFPHG